MAAESFSTCQWRAGNHRRGFRCRWPGHRGRQIRRIWAAGSVFSGGLRHQGSRVNLEGDGKLADDIQSQRKARFAAVDAHDADTGELGQFVLQTRAPSAPVAQGRGSDRNRARHWSIESR